MCQTNIINNIIIGNISFHEAYEKVKSKDKENIIQRKPISSLTLKHLISRSNSHCEICDWGGLRLEGVLIPHHIHKYSDTQDNSLENLIMICPNCHNIIHTLENCKDNKISETIYNNLDGCVGNEIKKYVEKLKENISDK